MEGDYMENAYKGKRIDEAILSNLDVNKAGKIVTAKAWTELWGLVITNSNAMHDYCISIEQIRINWEESVADLEKTKEEFITKYNAFKTGLVHYGEQAPTNAETLFWIKPVDNANPDAFVTNAELSALEKTVANKADKDSLNTKADKSQINDIVTVLAGKEDKSFKITSLDSEPLNHTFYASALAVYRKIQDAVGIVVSYFEDLFSNIRGEVEGKENVRNKAKTYDEVDTTSQEQYLSTYATTQYLGSLYASVVDVLQPQIANKADKVDTANVVKGTASGTGVVTIKDVSPIEHNVDVKVKAYSKTLSRGEQIPITAYLVCGFGDSYETNGVTYNVDTDGTIRTSGTYDNSMYFMPFMIYSPPSMSEEHSYKLTEGATYEFRCLNEKSTDYYAEINIINSDASATFGSYRDYGDGVIFTVPDEPPASGAYYLGVMIDFVRNGYNTDGLTFNPMFYNYEETIEEVSTEGTEIRVCGKNLLSINEAALTASSEEFAIERIPSGKYYLSANVSNAGTGTSKYQLCFYTKDKQISYHTTNFGSGVIELPEDAYYLRLWNIAGASNTYWKDIQVETGDIRTAFEPFKEIGTYAVTSNSEVELPSFSPSMSFISSIPKAKLTCEYNRDTNTIVENKMELIGEYTYTGKETSKAVYFSKDKNGNPLKLDEIAIYIDLGASVSIPSGQAYSCYVNAEGLDECMFYKSGNGSSVRYYQAYAKRCDKGYWFNIGYINMASATYNGQAYYNYVMSDVDYIYKLKVNMPLIQAGAKLRVYGRRVS